MLDGLSNNSFKISFSQNVNVISLEQIVQLSSVIDSLDNVHAFRTCRVRVATSVLPITGKSQVVRAARHVIVIQLDLTASSAIRYLFRLKIYLQFVIFMYSIYVIAV